MTSGEPSDCGIATRHVPVTEVLPRAEFGAWPAPPADDVLEEAVRSRPASPPPP